MKRMIKNLLLFLGMAGAIVFLHQLIANGLGNRWDEVGLVIMMAMIFLLIMDHDG